MNLQADSLSGKELLAQLAADPPDTPLRIAVLAAHPDDETIGASSVLARFSDARVVYLSDGAPRDTKLWPPEMRGSRGEYAAIRRDEAIKALAHAGIAKEQVLWLGGVDQETIFEAQALTSKLGELLRQLCPFALITHPYEGGHPDHDCAALVARLAATALGREAPHIIEMTSYHARNGSCVAAEFLDSPTSLEVELALTEHHREFKRKMIDEYKSQRLVLENFPTVSERMRVAPAYDFSRPPHEGKLWYECMGWAMSGARWRELAAKASLNASNYRVEKQESSCA